MRTPSRDDRNRPSKAERLDGPDARRTSITILTVEVIDGETFGRRLARLRKEAGYSQRALAEEIGISYRMVAYYEAQTTHPPANLLPTIADALGLTVDQLLGHRSIRPRKAPTNERLLRQLRQVEKLPPHARRSVLEHIDGLVAKYGSRG